MGVLVVLVALGVNVYRSARRGPRWKRALITAGLVTLGMMGTTGCIRLTCYAMPPPPPVEETRQELQAVGGRVDLLERQMALNELGPEVVRQTLRSIQEQMRMVPVTEQLKLLNNPARTELIKKRKLLDARIARLWAEVAKE